MFKYRPSDFITGRFWQIDPLAEQFVCNSPYAFDEVGRLVQKTFLPDGAFTYGGAKDYIIRFTDEKEE